MFLNNHSIDEGAIVGIGPLMLQQHPDEVQALGYGVARNYYEVHLVSRTIIIYSPYFKRKEESQLQQMKDWQAEYKSAFEALNERFTIKNL